MNAQFWGALNLRRARLADIDRECGPFDPVVQPRWGTLAIFDPERERAQTQRLVRELRAQEPVERIINTLFQSAIRDGAQRLTIEPDERGVRVRHTIGASEREHLHLPSTTLGPMVARLRSLAQLSGDASEGRFRVQIEQQIYDLRVWLQTTNWGERVEVSFAPVS